MVVFETGPWPTLTLIEWQPVRGGMPRREGTRSASAKVSAVAEELVEVALPVVGHHPRRPGSRLAQRVMLGRGERRTVAHLVGPVVVVPALAGFEASDDPMTRSPSVSASMLCGRGIATPDVAAIGTAPQMKPPPTGGKALNTAITAGRHTRVDQGASHRRQATHPIFIPTDRRCCPSGFVYRSVTATASRALRGIRSLARRRARSTTSSWWWESESVPLGRGRFS